MWSEILDILMYIYDRVTSINMDHQPWYSFCNLRIAHVLFTTTTVENVAMGFIHSPFSIVLHSWHFDSMVFCGLQERILES